ncbi:MAG: permease prefix domain 1-containing protein [Oscillospiraceae bacterium]|nr:permease prefix domain 1-containing protein [Oscillospiraceae bacterium]
MREKVYVDRLFADCADTRETGELKEEVAANLMDRVRELTQGGLDGDEAFEKATSELGDITAIAEEAGKKTRNETLGRMYINAKVKVTKRTAAGMSAATSLVMLVLGILALTLFGEGDGAGGPIAFYLSAAVLSVACGLYAYFGLTQETASHYAVKGGRAAAYGLSSMAGVLGVGLVASSIYLDGWAVNLQLALKATPLIPAVCMLVFLLATEEKRQKPWLKAMEERMVEGFLGFRFGIVDPVRAARFGVASGGVWLLAVAVFCALGLAIGWHVAWVVFLFALAAQVFMTSTIFGGASGQARSGPGSDPGAGPDAGGGD